MRRRLLALTLSTVAALSATLVAPAAQASTGGTEDTANRYANVALVLAYADDGGRYRCSATLVTPTVLLTAAHCTDGNVGKTLVDFRPVIAREAPTPPATLFPAAADATAGYTQAEVEAAGFRSGSSATHPDYSDFTDEDNWNDVGVVVLDRPVTDIAPASLAPVGTLDRIKKSNLSKTLFRGVGYGTEVRKSDSGPQKPTAMTYPLVRRYVDMPGQKLTPQILQTNGNPHDTRGTGGTCFGDSGGPVLLDGAIVGVTSYGLNDVCRYLGGYQRVDISVARSWLATYGVR